MDKPDVRYFVSPFGGLIKSNNPNVITNLFAKKWREVLQDEYQELLQKETDCLARQNAGLAVEDA
jgi:hypothetical protein